ncbi:MAG TPA: hypothetical protein VFK15_00845 [Burkholderiales bacterium]|nr:hypothetical protein [Burkholderiales bacterium]
MKGTRWRPSRHRYHPAHPVDVVDSLKAIAPHKGYAGYQTLLKAYICEGLRRERRFTLRMPSNASRAR